MENIFNKISEAISNNTPSWLVTVSNVTGSTPAAIGMKMIVYTDGTIYGTVGGGEIEKKIIDRIISGKTGKTEKWSYNLGTSDKESESTNMVCGGIQEVIVEPLLTGSPLYIIGGGHCGMALSSLASKTGFLVTVLDNREEWASKTKHPCAADAICCNYNEIENHISFSKDIFIVIMTHGHIHDALVLDKLVNKEYKYIGMIGSKSKVKIVLENLAGKGINKKKIENVFSPVGLDLLTHRPDEIAVSIVAQMIAVRNGKEEIVFNQNPLKSGNK